MDFAGKDKATYVKETFNAIAGHYDLMNTLMSFGMDKGWRRNVVRHVGAQPGKNILDVCCGTGQMSLELAAAVGSQGQVIGVDFSENMLEVARKRKKGSSWSAEIDFWQGDAMALPFPDNSFDGATVGWGLRNLPNLYQGIREMVRVVKPGSKVVSLDMAKPTLPVFKQGYWFYFEKLIPFMGSVFAGKESAYRYLHDSAVQFPSQQELVGVFSECGLIDAKFENLAGGVVAIVEGKKPL
ncbi:MAG: bifunctional demethylmenaquinone methyltransferase/2-methoxy-6-polyprenyl-1,4-benzoquinol methylase UbiE [Desulfitobacteriaceae bacterium]